MADPKAMARQLMEKTREHFLNEPRESIPPIAYVISPDGTVTLVPSVGATTLLKVAFYDRVRLHTRHPKSCAVCIIGLATLTHESGTQFEVLLSQYQHRSGQRQMWYARVTRSPLRTYVGPWLEPDGDTQLNMLDRENFFDTVN